MKKSILLFAFVATAMATTAVAQEKTAPRTEFLVELSTANLELMAGQSRDITISLLRSKSFSKAKATVGTSSVLPQGVTITFEPADNVGESAVAHIALAPDATPGTYNIILNSTMQYKTKGKTLTLVVTHGTRVISANE